MLRSREDKMQAICILIRKNLQAAERIILYETDV